ncbi:hypothetical protein NQ314_003627, partial [Rhamnusium bicolor]
VKVWFQNRRMKHKRQTLGKQGEDGDDKDSVTSEGSKSAKLSDKFLDDELSKKSCQGCEMPAAGLCGSQEEMPDITSTRGNNNNTPSATNNNTNFNNNSNGASSIGSSSSFDKLMNEEDSRSNEDSGSHTSPRIPKKNSSTPTTAIVKVESRRNSPNSCDRKIGMSKVSPSPSHSKENSTSLNQHENLPIKMSPKGSTIPGTPTVHPSPLGMPTTMMYPHLQRSSPTTATAIASATVTIQNVPNSVPAFASRGSSSSHFPNQYHMNNHVDYRPDGRSKHYQMTHMYSGEMYNPEHPTVNDGQPYHRGQSHPNNISHATSREISNRITGRGRQSYHPSYTNQQQYYYSKGQAGAENYTIGNQNNYAQGYQGEHPGYNHYAYTGNNVYPNDGTESMGAHMPNSVQVNHDPSSNYYPNDNMHSMSKVQNQADYPSKVAYYENSAYSSNQLPPSSDSTYNMPTEIFPGASNSTAGIMTPPASIQTENSDNYNNFHQFYSGESTQSQVAPPGESSNSSSDFNFLSNLANDYTPEYYQI